MRSILKIRVLGLSVFTALFFMFSCGKDEPTCGDGIQNGNEIGVDCGGDCVPCPTCTDGIHNGNETGTDCGGTCNPCLDLEPKLIGLWRITALTLDGADAFPILGFEALYYKFAQNANFESFNRRTNGQNNLTLGSFTVNNLNGTISTTVGSTTTIYNITFSNNNTRFELIQQGQNVTVSAQKITDNLCQGIDCNAGTCVYGYCNCPNGNNTDNCLGIGDIGQAGGIIFYDKGSYSNGWRYLEASTSDQSESAKWGAPINSFIGNTSNAVGSGKENTKIIFDKTVAVGSAVSNCYSLQLGGKIDWFLPSKDELTLLYEKRNLVGQFANGIYWSSSESTANSAWVVSFINGVSDDGAPKQFGFRVRAIRRF